MIEDLTREKLIQYGFDKEQINRLLTWENHESIFGEIYASNIDKKIYSGFEGKVKIFSKSLNKDKNYELANDLIQKRIELERSVNESKINLDKTEKEIEVQRRFAERGLEHNYIPEIRKELNIKHKLNNEEIALDKIKNEIETIKLAADLKKSTDTTSTPIQKAYERINVNKLEREKEREAQRKRDYERFIDQNYNYSPNLDDFKEKAQILKLQSLSEYLVFLRTAKETYSNAKYYYGTWGDKFNYDIPTYKICESIVNFASDEIKKELPKAEKKETKDEEEKEGNKIEVLKKRIAEKNLQPQQVNKFENYLTNYKIDKIQTLLTKYIKATPEALAVLSFAFELQNIRPRTGLYEAINNSFQTNHVRQKIEYHFKQCENSHNHQKQTQIKALRKEIQDLTNN